VSETPETKTIEEITEDEQFVGFYVLKRFDLREFDGGSRLDIEIADRTGSLPGVIWDDIREMREILSKGMVVKVRGRLGTYRDKPQVKIERIRVAKDAEYAEDSFIPKTQKDIPELVAAANRFVESLTDPNLSHLAKDIFSNEKFIAEFSRSPGGMQWHHPYIGGLLEHSVGVTDICDFVASRHTELNRDLLVLAALLHDVGKIREYSATTIIEFTDSGRLEGHIVMGDRFVRAFCDKIPGFPDDIRMLLSHLILSHQGHREFSSPIEPMIPEGFVLYFADEMDSKLNALRRIADKKEDGEAWSDYIRTINRYIFLGREDATAFE